MQKTIPVPRVLKEFAAIFNAAGYSAYLVGGAVRDYLLGLSAQDWDVATSAPPAEIRRLFKKTIPTGIAHGTITVIFKGQKIETTTFRRDSGYSDGRRPDAVTFAPTIEDDLARRDFTMNAIAAELPGGKLADPYGGRSDIKKGIIRTVGDPQERFTEDGLRPMRCVRFAAQLGFSIAEETLAAIPAAARVTALVSKERVRDELIRILLAPRPSIGLRLMEQSGLLELFIPELTLCRNAEQGGWHKFDVLDHLFYTCDGAPPKLLVRLAALFHDIGKPAVKSQKNGSPEINTFYGHELVSAKITEKILTRLRFSSLLISDVCALISAHMFNYDDSWSDAAVRRFLTKITAYSRAGADAKTAGTERLTQEIIDDLFNLRLADMYGTAGERAPANALLPFYDRIQAAIKRNDAITVADLKINGRDLLREGIPEGRYIGVILKELLETVLSDPKMNDKDKLLKTAKRIYQNLLEKNVSASFN